MARKRSGLYGLVRLLGDIQAISRRSNALEGGLHAETEEVEA